MKISLDWLSDYIEIDRSAEQVAAVLSDLGFPTEGIEQIDGDTVIDIEVSSNRGDCLSHIGIARELAAATGKKLKMPRVKLPESERDVSEFVDVRIDDAKLCGRYIGRVICGVKIGPSPQWMRKRLEAVGIRSVNNVVDATNYAMMEIGQPPHAFDCEKINGNKIIIRKAVLGEQLVSIDGTKCNLDGEMLVIADEKIPVAIAGVMGGLQSEVSDSTTTILLEEAHFDPVTVRRTGRKLGLNSEASFRFERQVDIEMIDWASQRGAELIVQAAGGSVAKGLADVYPAKPERRTVGMRLCRMAKLLGIEVSKDKVLKILMGLGFAPECKQDGLVVCTVPTWRHDIYREVDLIEEVARSHGYDKIPVEHKINIEVTRVDNRERVACELRRYLNGCGFFETINISFIAPDIADLFADDPQAGFISVKEESGQAANLLRQNLTGSLLGVLKSNYNAGNTPCRIYELADTFKPAGDNGKSSLPLERTKLGMVCDSDFRQLRGVVEGVIGVINRDAQIEFKPLELAWTKAGAQISVDGKAVGTSGIVSAQVAGELGLDEVTVCAADLDFESLLELQNRSLQVKPIPRFPAVTRDISLIVEEKIRWADITDAIKKKASAQLEEVQFGGIYRGRSIADGKKSVTVSLRFRDEDGTLRHEVVDGFENEILSELISSVGAELRTV